MPCDGAFPLIWTRNDKALSVVTDGNVKKLLDPKTGEFFQDFTPPKESLSSYLFWSRDGTCLIVQNFGWYTGDPVTGKPRRLLQKALGASEHISDLAWAADGSKLACSCAYQTFLVEAGTGKHLRVLPGVQQGKVAVSPDGKAVAASSPKGVTTWDVATGNEIRAYGEHKGMVWSLAWSPDGKLLASANGEFNPPYPLHSWESDTGKTVCTLKVVNPHDRLSWSPDSRNLLYHAEDDKLRAVQVADEKELYTIKLNGQNAGIWSPNGNELVLTGAANCGLFEAHTGKVLHNFPWYICDSQWSPNGGILASFNHPTNIYLVDPGTGRRLRTLESPCNPVPLPHGRLAWSPDGKTVAAATGHTVQYWEPATGRSRGVLLVHPHFGELAIRRDGQYRGNERAERSIVMVVQKDDGTQEVLEPANFEQKYGFKTDPEKVNLLEPLPPPLVTPEGAPLSPLALVSKPEPIEGVRTWTIETKRMRTHHSSSYFYQAFRPDGRQLARATSDGVVRIWDPAAGLMLQALVDAPHEYNRGLAWSPDGKLFASASVETHAGGAGEVRVRNASDWRTVRILKAGDVRHLFWSPDGTRVGAFTRDRKVTYWDISTGQNVHNFVIEPEILLSYGSYSPVALSLNGTMLASAHVDKVIRLWEVQTGKLLRGIKFHDEAAVLAWSPDGQTLATFATDQLSLWDVGTGGLRRKIKLPVASIEGFFLAWSPNNREIYGGGKVYRSETGEELRTVAGMLLSPDGKTVATGASISDALTGKELRNFRDDGILMHGPEWSSDSKALLCKHYGGGTMSIIRPDAGDVVPCPWGAKVGAWSPDSKTFAVYWGDFPVALLDASSGATIRTLGDSTKRTTGVAWSPDGNRLVTAADDGMLRIWDTATGKLLLSWKDPQGMFGDGSLSIGWLAWSQDGKVLASLDAKGHVRLWDCESGKERKSAPINGNFVAWLADGKTLCTDSSLVDPFAGKEPLPVPIVGADQGCLPRDGKTMVFSNAKDRTLQVFDLLSGKIVRTLYDPLSPGIKGRALSPDGRRFALASGAGVQVWDTTTGRLLSSALLGPMYQGLIVSPTGHYRGNALVEREIVYVVQKHDGSQETLAPDEFERKYNWKNDPEKAKPQMNADERR